MVLILSTTPTAFKCRKHSKQIQPRVARLRRCASLHNAALGACLFSLLHPLHSPRGSAVDVVNKLELGVARPQLTHEGSVIPVVQIAEDRLDGFGGLFSVVEGNAAAMELVNILIKA